MSAPSFCCTFTAVAGIGLSPLTVARMIMSRSATVSPAASIAARLAAAAMSLVTSPGAATCRRWIPVCCSIQAPVVSSSRSSSAFSTTRAGTYRPVPRMRVRGSMTAGNMGRGG